MLAIDSVPKDVQSNVEFRRELLRRAASDRGLRAACRELCKEDLLFFINVFLWVYDPRNLKCSLLPFVTYPFQDAALRRMLPCFGVRDIIIEKSRAQGGTSLPLAWFLQRFQFYYRESFLLTSETKEKVDNAEDPDCMMFKLDLMLEYEPWWLKGGYDPLRHRRLCHMFHPGSRGVIDGVATTDNAGRGGRRTGALLDEFARVPNGYAMAAAISAVTNFRIFNSTPAPGGSAFNDLLGKKGLERITMHWRDHPEMRKGLYCTGRDGKVEVLDKGYVFPAEYPFILDGRTRSVFYDYKWDKATGLREMAQEWDIDYQASEDLLFRVSILDRLQKEVCRPPYCRGDLDYDLATLEPRRVIESPDGAIKFWCLLENGRPPKGNYVMGGDVAAGTGASNSALSVANQDTGEKVAEWVSPNFPAGDWAKRAVALGRLFRGEEGPAMMIWEANGGTGRNFGETVIENGYGRVYFRQRENSISKATTDAPGWWSTKETKYAMLRGYADALSDGSFINRSEEALEECKRYVYDVNGRVIHVAQRKTLDPSGAADNHGDVVIADGLACKLVRERMRSLPPLTAGGQRVPSVIPRNSVAGRRLIWEERALAEGAELEELRV